MRRGGAVGGLVAVLLLGLAGKVRAAVVINEVSPASEPEWVELYNLSGVETNLFGCKVYFDDSGESQLVEFNATGSAGMSKYLVIKQGEMGWRSNWLNNSGDEVKLVCEGFSDSFSYSKSDSQMTWGRYPDGGGFSSEMMAPSMGAANNQPPTPTATPAVTPTPTAQVSATPTIMATSTPKLTIKPTVIPKKTPGPSASEEAEEAVLGMREELKTPVATVLEGESKTGEKKFPILAGGLIAGGMGFVGVAAYPFAKQGWERYNERRKANGESTDYKAD